eukprot:scaffold604_cov111-Skeletonema_dohrnii-CCMP3373.AAC.6
MVDTDIDITVDQNGDANSSNDDGGGSNNNSATNNGAATNSADTSSGGSTSNNNEATLQSADVSVSSTAPSAVITDSDDVENKEGNGDSENNSAPVNRNSFAGGHFAKNESSATTASWAVDSLVTTAVSNLVHDDEGDDLSFDQNTGDSAPTSNLSVNNGADGSSSCGAVANDPAVLMMNSEGGMVSNDCADDNQNHTTSQPGVFFVPGINYHGDGIHTGYHSASASSDDIENQTALIEAKPVSDEGNEAAEIIDALQEQIESTREKLKVAQSQVARSQLAVIGVAEEGGARVESNDDEVLLNDNNRTKKKRVVIGFVLLLGMIAVVVGVAVTLTKNRSSGEDGEEGNEAFTSNQSGRNANITEGYSLLHVASKVGEQKNELLGTSIVITVQGEYVLSGSPGYSSGGGDEIGKGEVFNLVQLMGAASSENNRNNSSEAALNTTATSTTLLTERFVDMLFTNSTSGDRCGAAVASDPLGRRLAIGCPSTTGLGYVKVFGWDFTSSSPKQVLPTLYGKEIGDGFGVNIALGLRNASLNNVNDDRTLAIGSNSGYAQLWGSKDGVWHRLDDEDGGLLNHPEGKEGGEVAVSLPGKGGKLYVGYPSFDNDRGMVRSFIEVGETDITNVTLMERFDGNSFLQGSRQGDRFGADVDTDAEGQFVAIGSGGGGYVRAISLHADATSEEVEVRIVGNEIRPDSNGGEEESNSSIGSSSSESDFGSSVATGRVPYRGCKICNFELNGRRVAVGSSAGFRVYQFVEDESRWYQIAEQVSGGGMVEVSMSPDTVYLGVGTPNAEDGRGVLDAYKILDQEAMKMKEGESMPSSTGSDSGRGGGKGGLTKPARPNQAI